MTCVLSSIGYGVVGCGDTLFRMHREMMHHADHRNILLSGKVNFVGIGMIHISGRSSCGWNKVWATAISFG